MIKKYGKLQTKEERHRGALDESIKGFKKRLEMDLTLIFSSRGEGQTREDIRSKVVAIMENKELTESNKIEQLKKIGLGYSGGLDVIENYNTEEWTVEK